MLTKFIMVIILQYIQMLNHYVVHLDLVCYRSVMPQKILKQNNLKTKFAVLSLHGIFRTMPPNLHWLGCKKKGRVPTSIYTWCLLSFWSSSDIYLLKTIPAAITMAPGDGAGDRKDEVPGPRSFWASDTKQMHE